MTKAWDAVREETCRLYGEGRSLEHIRKHLLRERHFEASTRAFRLKLKAWKAKRSDSACSACGSIPHDERERCSPAETSNRTVSLPSPRDLLGQTTGQTTKSLPDGIAPTPPKPLGRIFEELVRCQKLGDQAGQGIALRMCDFSAGTTSILHHAAKEPQRDGRNAVILKILAHMQRLDVSPDAKDEFGQTALAIAIKTNQSSLVSLLLEHGATAQAADPQGYQPLHLALQTGASSSIFQHLLSHGASSNVIMLRYQQAMTPLSFAIDRLAQDSVQAPKAMDGTCFKWFDILGTFIQHGAGVGNSDLKSIVRLFNRYWHLSQGSDELLECATPVLRAYLKSGLDPTLPVSGCDTDSLAHSAFHHSQNNSLATFLIEEAELRKHGSALVWYILTTSDCTDCPYPGPNLNEALRMLFGELSRLKVPLSYDPLIECLNRSSEEDQIDFLTTIQELRPAHRRGETFERRDDFVKAITSLPRSVRFDVAELLLQRTSPYDGIADIMTSVQTSLIAYASIPEMIEAPMRGFLGFCDCSKETKQDFIQSVIHVATKEAIKRLDRAGASAREQLGKLVALREWYRLPGIKISQGLLAQTMGCVIDGRRTYVPNAAYANRPEISDVPGWVGTGLEA